METVLAIGLPLVLFAVVFALLYRLGKRREAVGELPMRGRVTPRQNAVLIALCLLGAPLVLVLLQLDNARSRQLILFGYFVVVAVVGALFRLRSERTGRD